MAGSPRLPARNVPLLYFGTAHVSLALACLLTGLWPRAVAGFFYHSWIVALVHLVTLGWITFSILGAFYIVAPLALRTEMPEHRADYVAFGFAIVGLAGMVTHFWLQAYGGMAWSAGTIILAILYMTVRMVVVVRRAAVHPAVKLHVALAGLNIWIAATMGLLIAWDRVSPFLPGYVLTNVFAHAHLAAVGWAMMMVIGVGYRLLPMVLPAKIPSGPTTYASAILLEIGVLGLFVSLLAQTRYTLVFGFLIVAGVIAFGAHVVWMARHRVPRPVDAPRPDFGQLHAASAGLHLVAAVLLGLVLLTQPMSPFTLHLAGAYGVVALLGFLAQMVVGMQAKLLPMVVWFWAYARTGYRVPPPSPHTMRDRSLQAIVFGGWTIGVPVLATGMFLESSRLVSLGAWALFAAVATATLDNVWMIRSIAFSPSTSGRPSPR